MIDVLVSRRRGSAAVFACPLSRGASPAEVTIDRAPVYPRVIDEPPAGGSSCQRQYAINRVEADYGRLKARLRSMRGLKTISSARTIFAAHAFVPKLRRGHYAITACLPARDRVRVAFDELAHCL